MTDWPTIASLATAGGTLVLAVFPVYVASSTLRVDALDTGAVGSYPGLDSVRPRCGVTPSSW
jgi:hypothetical protein